MFEFSAKIYKNGINACADVPKEITDKMEPLKGYIKVTGKINGFDFEKNLVPVKNKPYRLFINIPMLKGAGAKIGGTVDFALKQNLEAKEKNYPTPKRLTQKLKERKLLDKFNKLSDSRKKDILKYLNYIKTAKTLEQNIDKLIIKLENNEKNIRIP